MLLERVPIGHGKFWNVRGFIKFYEKSWKSTGILHNIYPMNFLFQIVYMSSAKLLCMIFHKFFPYLPVPCIKI